MKKDSDNILVFDIETTGLDTETCRIVQIAWALYTDKEILLEKECYIVRPDGFIIPLKTVIIHGITTEHAMSVGQPITIVLENFGAILARAKRIVAHNIKFDYEVICAEF